jgi:hypothetical protein
MRLRLARDHEVAYVAEPPITLTAREPDPRAETHGPSSAAIRS